MYNSGELYKVIYYMNILINYLNQPKIATMVRYRWKPAIMKRGRRRGGNGNGAWLAQRKEHIYQHRMPETLNHSGHPHIL